MAELDGRPGHSGADAGVGADELRALLELGHPGADATPHVLVTSRPAQARPAQPVRVKPVIYEREMPGVKHVGLFGTLCTRRDAQRAGFDDVLFTDPAGNISEGATWNVGFVVGERVVWPKADVLSGVTVALLNRVMHSTPATEVVNLSALTTMDAAFVTNAAVGGAAGQRYRRCHVGR